jgi:hypothetical protein
VQPTRGAIFPPPRPAAIGPFARRGEGAENSTVTVPSRNGAAFRLILSETARQYRHFCRLGVENPSQAIELSNRLKRAQKCAASAGNCGGKIRKRERRGFAIAAPVRRHHAAPRLD